MNAQTVGWLVLLALIQKLPCTEQDGSVSFKLQDIHLEAKEGSCIEIKCKVIRIIQNVNDAYWFWMKDRNWDNMGNDYKGTIIYSTSSTNRPVSPDFADRVTYIGSQFSEWSSSIPPNPQCGILICDLKKTDSGKYSVRFVGTNNQKWSSKDEAILTVKDNPCPIVFEKPPVVKENETITLTCSTSSLCSSKPQIEGLTQLTLQQFPMNQPHNEHSHSLTVSFTAAWKDDGKKFSCQTRDSQDKYLVRNINLSVEYAPKDTSDKRSSITVKEGESVTLTCSAKGRPNPTFTWLPVQSSLAEWKISSIKDSQSGEYHCEAHNKHGTTKLNPVNISVVYAPDVEIKMTSPQFSIKQGNEMNLTCNVKRSNPQPDKYAWFKGGTKVNSSQIYYIQRIEPEHAGSYECKAINSVGTGSSQPLPITVKYGPRKTSISLPGSQKRVKVGQPLTFTCNADANPVPNMYSWDRISKNKQTHSSQWTSNTTNKTLHLQSVQRADEACYICNATNSINTGGNSLQSCIEVLYPPTNLMLSMDTEVREGQRITISCTVESFPLSSLTLTKTSLPNARSPEWDITKSTEHHDNNLSHTFNASSTDAGSYTCTATNSEGSETSTQRKLVVKHTPQNVTIEARPHLEVNENTSLTLVCNALSHPPVTSVTWMKIIDGKDVNVNRNPSFTLKSVAPSDSGRYRCTATNEMGSEKSEHVDVKIKYAPKHTHITRVAEQQLNDERSAVMLRCNSDSYPEAKQFAWYKMDVDKQDIKVSDIQNYTVHSDQQGVYYCTAENEINKGKSKPVELFLDDGLTTVLICSVLLIPLIIIVIVVIYRCRRNKSIQQGTSNSCLAWRNGDRRRNPMSEPGLAEPSSSRDELVPDQPRRPNAQPCQPHPDRTGASNINSVYCNVDLRGKQGPSAQKPNTNQGGHMKGDALNYASVYFGNKQKQSNTEQDIYVMASMPKLPKKKEQEAQEIYENMSTTHAAKSPNPQNYDSTDSSEDEAELNYSQVTFNTAMGRQRADTDSSTSDEEYETQYTEVKI